MPGPARSRRGRRSVGVLVVFAAPALLLGACRDPDLSPPVADDVTTSESANEPGPANEVLDPREAALAEVGDDLLATLRDVQLGFDALARASSIDDARPIVLRLRAVLAADPRWQDLDGDGTADVLGVRSLLPGPAGGREDDVDYGDAFSAVLAASQDAGALGAEYVDVLRDPIVSDLGAWQREPAGMLAAVERAMQRVRSVAQGEEAVNSLDGEGPRALAWALLAVRSNDLATVQAYGERGATHASLMLDAVTSLVQG